MAKVCHEKSDTSESSEDEEEARRISAAICDESLFTVKPVKSELLTSSSVNGSIKQKDKTNGKIHIPLKSNRPQDKNEDDDNVFNTTPEFRTYVAKQLGQLLDKELEKQLSDKVWQDKLLKSPKTETGVRLFSDSTSFCRAESPVPVPVKEKVSAPAVLRKRHLSSSSESSEDEKIISCVFTVEDIHRENLLLSSFSGEGPQVEGKKETNKSETDSSQEKVPVQQQTRGECSSEDVKKKKKTKKNKKRRKAEKRMLEKSVDTLR